MMEEITIGRLARLTGLTSKTIRFYEQEGYIPPAKRTASGYRTYSQADVRRLKLVKLCRLLGLSLTDIRPLVEKAFAVDCWQFATDLASVIEAQQGSIATRILELQNMSRELDDLKSHVEHCECEPGSTLATCEYCELI